MFAYSESHWILIIINQLKPYRIQFFFCIGIKVLKSIFSFFCIENLKWCHKNNILSSCDAVASNIIIFIWVNISYCIFFIFTLALFLLSTKPTTKFLSISLLLFFFKCFIIFSCQLLHKFFSCHQRLFWKHNKQ